MTGQIYDNGSSANQSMSIGLRNSSGSNVIEMGFYNDPARYVTQVSRFDGTGSTADWVAFPAVSSSPVIGWHTFIVEISNNSVDFSLDLGSDHTFESTQSFVLTAQSEGFNVLRIGGPKNGPGEDRGARFDNLLLETISVPEPTIAGVYALLGCLCMIRRRR